MQDGISLYDVLAATELAEGFGSNTIRKGSKVALNATDEAFLAEDEQAVVSCYKSGNTMHIQISRRSDHMGARMSCNRRFDMIQARTGSWMVSIKRYLLAPFLIMAFAFLPVCAVDYSLLSPLLLSFVVL